MGLDIYLKSDGKEKTIKIREQRNQYGLSRGFCNFIFRKDVIHHEAELDQIGKITNTDISSIYQMENYPDEESLEFELDLMTTQEAKQKVLDGAEKSKAELENNLEKVLFTISSLIEKLSKIENLNKLLLPTDYDTLDADEYFSDFNTDKEDNYARNNFGQDLRNFKRSLEFVKENGAKTVWFMFG